MKTLEIAEKIKKIDSGLSDSCVIAICQTITKTPQTDDEIKRYVERWKRENGI